MFPTCATNHLYGFPQRLLCFGPMNRSCSQMEHGYISALLFPFTDAYLRGVVEVQIFCVCSPDKKAFLMQTILASWRWLSVQCVQIFGENRFHKIFLALSFLICHFDRQLSENMKWTRPLVTAQRNNQQELVTNCCIKSQKDQDFHSGDYYKWDHDCFKVFANLLSE